ncbi:MAG: galactose oxidase [Rikenellaceae bacterium]|nr:galactose oxidase [Rikenellaceae bacterium]
MKKKGLYAAFVIMALFIYTGCSSSGDDELWGNWVNIGDFDGYSRSSAVAFTIGDKAYVGTGYSGRNADPQKRINDFWVYDGTSWSQLNPFPGPSRNRAVGFSIGNYGYVGLGSTEDDEFFSDFYKFDPSGDNGKGTWTKLADDAFPGTARHSAVAFSVNGYGFVGCGSDGSGLKDFYRFDPSTERFTECTSIGGSKRIGASAFVIDNIAYVVGGQNNLAEVNDFWSYDAATDTWKELRKIANVTDESYDDDYTSIMRSYGSAFVIDGKGYISTGTYNSYVRSTTWEYDPATDLWEELHAFEGTGRSEAVGFTVFGRGYVLTGKTGSTQLDNMFEFRPWEEYNEYD